MTDLATVLSACSTAVVAAVATTGLRAAHVAKRSVEARLARLEQAMARVETHLLYMRRQADPDYRPTLSTSDDPDDG